MVIDVSGRLAGNTVTAWVCASCLAIAVCIASVFPLPCEAADLGQLLRPLPFAGPYRGTVADSEKGTSIPGALIEVEWKRHDNPLPDGPGHHTVKMSAKTDSKGCFNIEKQETRGGLFATDVTIRVAAQGYIRRVIIIDPKGTPLPRQTVDWPFQDTSVSTSLPDPLDVVLKPAMPIILRALQSKDPLIRQTAEQELRQLKKASAGDK